MLEVKKSPTWISLPIGEIRIFYSHVIVPQFIAFVALIVFSAIRPNILPWEDIFSPLLTTESLAIKLSVIIALFLLNLLYQKRALYLTLNILRAEFFWISIILFVGVIGFKLPLVATFFVPTAIAISLLSVMRLKVRSIIYVIAPVIIFSVLLFLYDIVFAENQSWLIGAGSIIVSTLIALSAKKIDEQNTQGNFDLDESLKDAEGARSEESINEREKSGSQTYSKLSSSATFLAESMDKEFRWRFVPLAIIVGAAVLFFAISENCRDVPYYVSWVIILLIQVIIFFQSSRRDNLYELQSLWLLAGCSFFIWWMNAFVYGVIDLSTSETGLLLIMLGLSTVPWIKEFNIAITILFSVFAAIHVIASSTPIFMFMLDGFVIVYTMYRNARHYVRFSSAVLLPRLLTTTREILDPKNLIESLSESLRLLGDAKRILVTYGKSESIILGGGQIGTRDIDPLFVQGLVSLARDQDNAVGLLFKKHMGRQFDPALFYWFGEIPSSIYFCRVILPSEDKSEIFYVFLPVSYTVKLIGAREFQEYASGLLQNIGIRRSPQKLNQRVSQVIVTGGGGIDSKEEDLNHLIHLVNNSAQDLSIVVDNCRSVLEQLEGIVVEKEKSDNYKEIKERFNGQISYLDGALRSLSASVSDVKWLREIASMKKAGALERVNIVSALEEAAAFVEFKIRRSGAKQSVDLNLEASLGILVVSREFLEASLRTLLKAATRNFGCDDVIKLKAWTEEGLVVVQITDSSERKSKIDDYFIQGRDTDSLRSIKNFFALSQARIDFSKGLGENHNIVKITFKVAKVEQREVMSGGWVLLVDDKAEIVTFYSSVAEALGLTCGSATNLAKARELLLEKGEPPSLVVTDLQLDQENGLDLVREIRTQYGTGIPIIVVSGNIEDNLKDQIFSAGASKYLTKPVGRRKLFFEIKELLDGHGGKSI